MRTECLDLIGAVIDAFCALKMSIILLRFHTITLPFFIFGCNFGHDRSVSRYLSKKTRHMCIYFYAIILISQSQYNQMHVRWKTDGFEPSFVGTMYEKKRLVKWQNIQKIARVDVWTQNT